MLIKLIVSNILLIEKLSVDFDSGLTVLTGETGAGKSILLDALGLALGARADFGLIRQNQEQANVAACFQLEPDHPAWALVADSGISVEDEMILRRKLKSDGKSHASINDTPVSVRLLQSVGDLLVEIQGQFEGRGLLNSSNHVNLLDQIAGHRILLAKTKEAWRDWSDARASVIEAQSRLEKIKADEDWLKDAYQTLVQLSPEVGEETTIESQRAMLTNINKIFTGLSEAEDSIFGEMGAETTLGRAMNALDRVAHVADKKIDPALDALRRIENDLSEVRTTINRVQSQLEDNPKQLHDLEDRLHALRLQARKHSCETDQLPSVKQSLCNKLSTIQNSSDSIKDLMEAAQNGKRNYIEFATKLAKSRAEAAAKLDKAVAEELPPLKLDGAIFKTQLISYEENQWGALGTNGVRFEASTNKGIAPGPLERIASGGELSRFLLALKICLEETPYHRTLIFDEVDAGVGGAVAAAVGERLDRLGATTQTLVVTHSPQVAARGNQHLQIIKILTKNGVISSTNALAAASRTEEIARMLAGETVTNEARAAAVALLEA